MANCVDPDQMPYSDLGLHCLQRPVCPILRDIMVNTPACQWKGVSKIALNIPLLKNSKYPKISDKMAYAKRADPDQTARKPIIVFTVCHLGQKC